MGISKNIRGIKNIGILGFSNLVGSGISALFWIYLAGVLGAENYGELSFYISIAGIATSLSFIGGPMAITVLVAKKVKIESTIHLFSILGSIIAAIILYFAFTNIGLSIYVLGAVIYNLSVSELLGRKFYKKYSLYFITQKILFVLLSLILYYVIGPEGVLMGIGLSFIPFAIPIYLSFKNTPINFQLLKTKWKFMGNNFLIDLAQVFNGQIDRLLIGPFFGFTLLGNYYLAIQILNLLSIMPEIVKKYTLPEESSGENTNKIKILTVLFSIILALVGIFVAPAIISIVFPEYIEAIDLIPVISISIIPTTVYTLYVSKFLSLEKSGYIVITSIVSIIILVIGIFTLGNSLGNIGLAYSLVLSDIARALMIFCFSRTKKIKDLRN
jgi:O-antigen/teichoic acid export membrane protein